MYRKIEKKLIRIRGSVLRFVIRAVHENRFTNVKVSDGNFVNARSFRLVKWLSIEQIRGFVQKIGIYMYK